MNIKSLDRSKLTRFAWLSIAVAILTISLKTIAYLITNSVGLLSDAIESIVNLIGALMALAMLTIAARPADENHAYGTVRPNIFQAEALLDFLLNEELPIPVSFTLSEPNSVW